MEMRTYDIGILGGGQLARMSVQAAQRMGLRCLVLDPDPACPAGQVTAVQVGAISDPVSIQAVFEQCDRVTLENEFIPAAAIEGARLAAGREEACLVPGTASLAIIQDKLRQREAYAAHAVPGPPALADIEAAAAEFGFPLVLKTRFMGYDGKGTRIAKSQAQLAEWLPGFKPGDWFAEEFVPFRRELAVMVARTPNAVRCFPTMESVQVDAVCDLVFPAGADASSVAIQAVEAVQGFGLFGVELFELPDGSVQVNEIAPRPHNSGHYSLDWGGISQFEAHVRLVMGWPMPEPVGQPTAMANLLAPSAVTQGLHEKVLQSTAHALGVVPECHVHWYGKQSAKHGRKMGHINAVGPDARARVERARQEFWKGW